MIVFDIDGTLSIPGDRLKYIHQAKPADWDAFFEACDKDEYNIPVVELCSVLSCSYSIIYVTGRPERVREKTLDWLKQRGLPCRTNSLYMRKDGDFRHDCLVKPELILHLKDHIHMVFEDRSSMVQKWRELGLTCLQVADGDF